MLIQEMKKEIACSSKMEQDRAVSIEQKTKLLLSMIESEDYEEEELSRTLSANRKEGNRPTVLASIQFDNITEEEDERSRKSTKLNSMRVSPKNR